MTKSNNSCGSRHLLYECMYECMYELLLEIVICKIGCANAFVVDNNICFYHDMILLSQSQSQSSYSLGLDLRLAISLSDWILERKRDREDVKM